MKSRLKTRCAVVALSALLCAPQGFAYYHFTRYLTRTAPFTPVPERFDLNVLQNKTLPYLISEDGPTAYAPGDSFAAVVSQIEAAAAVWSGVSSSELRLSFGGLFTPGTRMDAPAIEVLFQDEMAPGIIAMGGPVTLASLTDAPAGSYVPIVKSQLILRKDLSSRASWTEGFFLTLVHELGHTLGLQHTWTGSVMSTEITRATTKSDPIAADDVAGISLLYPVKGFAESTGKISGQVTWNGQGIALASVVALTSRGAISALTNPDGTYTISGVPGGYYFVYAQPLPPAYAGEMQPVNLVLPTDPDGHSILPGTAFDTLFWPGTRMPVQAVQVNPGETVADISFAVQKRNSVAMHSIQTYSFIGQQVIKPAHILLGEATGSLVLTGAGLVTNNAPTPGLGITVANAGEFVTKGGMRPYDPAPYYIQLELQLNPFASFEGLRHLIFTLPNDTHVQPSALRFVASNPPTITSVSAAVDRAVFIDGTELNASTRILFDGVTVPSSLVSPNHLQVTLPAALGGHRATIVALNADGQSSLFTNGTDSPAYNFDPANTPQIALNIPVLPAGVETVVELSGLGTQFDPGALKLGFGTSDVTVRRLWVTGPDKVLANIGTNQNAPGGVTDVSVSAGLQVVTAPAAFQLLPGPSQQMYLSSGGVAATQGEPLTVAIANMPVFAAAPSLTATFGARAVQVLKLDGNLVTIQVLIDQPLGPNVLRLRVNNADSVLPIAIQVEAPPPLVLGAFNQAGQAVDADHPVFLGDTIRVQIALQGNPSAALDKSQLTVASGAVKHAVVGLAAIADKPGNYYVDVILSDQTTPGPVISLVVSIDGHASAPLELPLQPLPNVPR
jgi:hypothetical protein